MCLPVLPAVAQAVGIGYGTSKAVSAVSNALTPTPPNIPSPPKIAPLPTQTDVNPQISAANRRAKIQQQMQYGMLSTMKSSSGGISGVGAELNTPAAAGAKKNLGS